MILVAWYGANAYSLWANAADWRNYRRGRIPSAKGRCLGFRCAGSIRDDSYE